VFTIYMFKIGRVSYCVSSTFIHDVESFLLIALVGKVMQLVVFVCPSVCFYSILWTDWRLNWCLCLCMGLDHSSPAVESQCQRSVSIAYGHGNIVTRSVWPPSSIEDGFSSCASVTLPCKLCFINNFSAMILHCSNLQQLIGSSRSCLLCLIS